MGFPQMDFFIWKKAFYCLNHRFLILVIWDFSFFLGQLQR